MPTEQSIARQIEGGTNKQSGGNYLKDAEENIKSQSEEVYSPEIDFEQESIDERMSRLGDMDYGLYD